MKAHPCFAAAVLLVAAATLSGAFAPGGIAYTKRAETALLSEPKMMASPVAHVAYARKLTIETAQGPWLRVSDGKKSGWVFSGNLSEAKPSERGVDALPIAASETSATTAARPLAPASAEYSQRHNLAAAADDLNWLQQEVKITPEEVQAYLEQQKKGEYQ